MIGKWSNGWTDIFIGVVCRSIELLSFFQMDPNSEEDSHTDGKMQKEEKVKEKKRVEEIICANDLSVI